MVDNFRVFIKSPSELANFHGFSFPDGHHNERAAQCALCYKVYVHGRPESTTKITKIYTPGKLPAIRYVRITLQVPINLRPGNQAC